VAEDEFEVFSVRFTVQGGSSIEGKAIRIGVRVLGAPSVRSIIMPGVAQPIAM
jgi:hypothetical protein